MSHFRLIFDVEPFFALYNFDVELAIFWIASTRDLLNYIKTEITHQVVIFHQAQKNYVLAHKTDSDM